MKQTVVFLIVIIAAVAARKTTPVATTTVTGTPLPQGNCGNPAIKPSGVGGATGTQKGEGRIVGGDEATPHSWPWMAALLQGNFQFCGGSLIAPQWVMTAGHCFYEGDDATSYTVRLGSHNDKLPEPTRVDAKIEQYFVNPQFNPTTITHDITLLKLTEPVKYTDAISPVCLPFSNDDREPDGANGVCTGWGSTREGGTTVPKLRQVVVPIVDHQQCEKSYAGMNNIDDTMICAGLAKGGNDSCQGDSGGPLVFYKDGIWYQHGIVSWGKGCAEAGYAGVYSRAAAYLDWIYATITNN